MEGSLIPKGIFGGSLKLLCKNTAYEGAWHIQGLRLFHALII